LPQQPVLLPSEIRPLLQAVLESPGETEPALRQAAQAACAALCLGQAAAGELPEALAPYLEKLALAPHSVAATDVTALAAAGYTEEAIFELTIAAALGAGLARLLKIQAALEAGADALEDPAAG
jgi:alkylhydroperoxidase family enzyme